MRPLPAAAALLACLVRPGSADGGEAPDIVHRVMQEAGAGGKSEVDVDGEKWRRSEGKDGSVHFERVPPEPQQDAAPEGSVGEVFQQLTAPLWNALSALENAENSSQAWTDFSAAIANTSVSVEVLKNATLRAGAEAYEHAAGFVSAVDWTEPWIQFVLAFHVGLWLMFAAGTWFGWSAEMKMVFFITIGLLAAAASPVNSWAMRDDNWKLFSAQKYFDQSGAFLAVVWCGPILALTFLVLISMLLDVGRLLVQTKRAQIVSKKRGQSGKQRKQQQQQQQTGHGELKQRKK
eukprot:TRINITY_DN4546_c0_g1_i1.p2 TRINITY_DN4546_c0_g1~~TRINITY_DN4546_c0_g1_i1.p2  ORF type:complete len:291 (+),score=121.48 TRINITY_DN4546_c0_g1_i1:84-956(+)